MLSNARFKTSFRKSLLNQAVIASLGIAAAGSAQAAPGDADLYMLDNKITIGSTETAIDTDGNISPVTVTRGSATNTLPSVTLPLADYQTPSTHVVRMGIIATIGSTTLEVSLGNATIVTNGQQITSFTYHDTAGPNYEKVFAYINLTPAVTINTEFEVPEDLVTGVPNGNEISFDMTRIINEIAASGDVADVLATFTSTGTIDYKIALNQISGTDGPGALRLGYFVGTDTPPFTESSATGNWTPGNLQTAFAGATYYSGKLVIEEPATGGGDPDPDPGEEEEVTVPQDDIDEVNEQTEQTDQQVDQELEDGSEISEETVNQTETVTGNAATKTGDLANETDPVETQSTLSLVEASSNTAVTGSKVVNANTSADKTVVTDSTKTVIRNSATLLNKVSQQNSTSGTQLSDTQKTQVQSIIVNMANAAKNVTSGSSGKETTAKEMKKDLETAFKAATQMKVPLSDEAETAIKEAAVGIQVAALAELTGKNSDEITQEDLQEAFNNEETRKKILDASPKLPLKNPRSEEDVEADISAYIAANYPAKSSDAGKSANQAVQDSSTTNPGESFDSDCDSNSGPGFELFPGVFISAGSTCLKEPLTGGAQTLSASEPSSGVTVNPADMTFNAATATTLLPVGDEVIKLAQLGQRAVPAGLTLSGATRPDGRITIIGSEGIALDLAPTAEDTIAMAIALDELGFPMTFRDDGSFELTLAGSDRFTGTFGFDPLPAGDRAACGDMTFTPTAEIEVNQPDYVFVAECENGIAQNIAPFVAEAGLYESLENGGFTVTTNRSTGVITVSGVGDFKPSFFSSAPTDAEAEYQEQTSDTLGFAYMPVDVNGDGRLDFKIITASSVQVMYSVP
ncbi:MAG: hypothetical protein P1V33_04035 [Pseudohongiella nitratireducens]|nr:hypothetical protein [Pseudohongiella nitratireducens]MDF1622625.1 hypothetical protein [Pseudohongiella nitratireducens]